MAKKILVMFAIAILSLSCSRLETRGTRTQDKEFIGYYNSWDVQKMEESIQKHIITKGYTEDVPRYQSMLAERIKAKKELEDIVETIREEILTNDLTTLENYMSSGIRGNATIRELKKIDFTRFRIYTSKLKYSEDRAENIVALNLGEETFYFNVNYEYKRSKWEIVDFKERR